MKSSNASIELKIIAFGIAKDILGGSEILLKLPAPLLVKDLLAALKERYPAFAELRSLAIAVNEHYAESEQEIHAQDEVVIIPPVAGG